MAQPLGVILVPLNRMDEVHCAAFVGNYNDAIEVLNCNKPNLRVLNEEAQ
jgi:hypothetical protein